jgi:hypothetical protein
LLFTLLYELPCVLLLLFAEFVLTWVIMFVLLPLLPLLLLLLLLVVVEMVDFEGEICEVLGRSETFLLYRPAINSL